MKAIKRTTLITVCISALYLLLSAIFSFTEISFRTWVAVLGKMFAAVFAPSMILVFALAFLCRSERVHQAVKTVCIAAAVLVCAIYIFFAMFFILLGSHQEKMLTEHLLVTDEFSFRKASAVYYRPTAFFFKKKTEITKEDWKDYLEEKYERTFGISKSGDIVYDVRFPEVRVSVWAEGMAFEDNYLQELTIACLLEAYRSLKMERGYHIMQDGLDGLEYVCLEAYGYDDIPALSEDILQLYEYVLSGRTHGNVAEIYRKHRGGVYYSFGEGAGNYTGVIFFGDTDSEQEINVEELVRDAYGRYGTGQGGQAQSIYEDTEKDISAEGEIIPEAEIETDYREVAARAVYDAVLSEEGFSYEVCYNAKGNLYIDLGSKTSEENGRTYFYRLVYDRPSKNGACELLVLYRSAEGSDNEGIVDMYAVETATGKVVVSGRKAWSDLGTEEYREMTGE